MTTRTDTGTAAGSGVGRAYKLGALRSAQSRATDGTGTEVATDLAAGSKTSIGALNAKLEEYVGDAASPVVRSYTRAEYQV